MEPTIIHPLYFQIVEKKGNAWHFKYGDVFYNRTGKIVPEKSRETLFGTTKHNLMVEFFRINCGRDGFYLANLRDQKYYYCGLERDDLRAKFKELGIGREDPVDYSSLPD